MQFLSKIQMTLITQIEKSTLKFFCKPQKTANTQGYMELKEQSEYFTVLNFKLHYRAIVIKKTAW
jgi:hypothetical protein